MQMLETATGKLFVIVWCAVSTVNNNLQFEVYAANIMELMAVFGDATETSTLTHKIDNMGAKKVYENYTVLNGIVRATDTTFTVSLGVAS